MFQTFIFLSVHFFLTNFHKLLTAGRVINFTLSMYDCDRSFIHIFRTFRGNIQELIRRMVTLVFISRMRPRTHVCNTRCIILKTIFPLYVEYIRHKILIVRICCGKVAPNEEKSAHFILHTWERGCSLRSVLLGIRLMRQSREVLMRLKCV